MGRPLQTFELEGTHPLRSLTFDAQGNGVCKGRMGTSGVSLSKPLGWLEPGASPQTLFGDGEMMPSQTHNH